ncbi:MAG: serine--tRNA ligase [Candidatus Omnitrophica bacterium]|nr:serine--tRNA ligase [Candidatus Omnitrophota bacterium]
MLDIKFIKENLDSVKRTAELKRCAVDLTHLLTLDDKRRALLQSVEQKKSLRNNANQEITQLRKAGKDFNAKIEEMKELAQEIKETDATLAGLETKIHEIMITIPNVTHPDVPLGKDATENKVIKEWGEERDFDFEPKDHLEIAEASGVLDMKRAGKVSGSGFGLYFGKGAMLERALINFMLDYHIKKHSYTEVLPPFLVNEQTMFGTGQLPKLKEDMYFLDQDGLYLIPTAEVPVTNIHRGEILHEKDLPIRYVSYTPCFRREAGSYGKDTRGISRVHQFNKVEMVKFTTPETSYAEHETLLRDAEDILQALGLRYRVMLLSAGDMSFAAAKCYDIEVWAPGSKRWLEVSSCSNFEDFQARRADIRYRPKEGSKTRFVHTLNASGVALPRTFIAILEQYQNNDSTFTVPNVLLEYCRH